MGDGCAAIALMWRTTQARLWHTFGVAEVENKKILHHRFISYLQLGQLSVIPPGLVLEAGGTST